MKKLLLLILIICHAYCYGQIISPNGDNLFYYNGNEDVIFRYLPRGTGGRALAHDEGNVLAINYGNDFTGGVKLGNNYYVGTNGSFRSNAWQPWGAAFDDFFVDVVPGTRILRTRNWNAASPNIGVTGIYIGIGYFETQVGIGTTNPEARLDVNGTILIKSGLTNVSARPPVGSTKIKGELRAYSQNGTASDDGLLRLSAGAGTSASVMSYIDVSSYSTIPDMDRNIVMGTSGEERLRVVANGNVGIGTTTPQEELSVNGKIRAKEIKVETANWPDYVFEAGYKPKSLQEIDEFIKLNKHLPDVPSAKEVAQNGIELGEMNKILLKKIEELTLHLIAKDKKVEQQDLSIQALFMQMQELQNLIKSGKK